MDVILQWIILSLYIVLYLSCLNSGERTFLSLIQIQRKLLARETFLCLDFKNSQHQMSTHGIGPMAEISVISGIFPLIFIMIVWSQNSYLIPPESQNVSFSFVGFASSVCSMSSGQFTFRLELSFIERIIEEVKWMWLIRFLKVMRLCFYHLSGSVGRNQSFVFTVSFLWLFEYTWGYLEN